MVAWKESFQASSTEGMQFVHFCLKFIACEKAKNTFVIKIFEQQINLLTQIKGSFI